MRRFALGLAASLFATSAIAGGLGEMTAKEQADFGDAVRDYLLEHPEVLIEAMDVLKDREAKAAAERDASLLLAKSDEVFANPNDWVGGNPQGDITLVEFMDYRCGYCRKAYDEVNTLVETDGNIRFIVKEYPILGEGSLLSAQFAIAVRLLHGDDAYKAAHDALMTLRGDPTPENLTRLATDLGLDAGPVIAKMASPEVKAVIDANHALGEVMEISGTPTFVLKDVMLRGYVPLDGMQEMVKDARAG
jgi:protein-disulfide isomerase